MRLIIVLVAVNLLAYQCLTLEVRLAQGALGVHSSFTGGH